MGLRLETGIRASAGDWPRPCPHRQRRAHRRLSLPPAAPAPRFGRVDLASVVAEAQRGFADRVAKGNPGGPG